MGGIRRQVTFFLREAEEKDLLRAYDKERQRIYGPAAAESEHLGATEIGRAALEGYFKRGRSNAIRAADRQAIKGLRALSDSDRATLLALAAEIRKRPELAELLAVLLRELRARRAVSPARTGTNPSRVPSKGKE